MINRHSEGDGHYGSGDEHLFHGHASSVKTECYNQVKREGPIQNESQDPIRSPPLVFARTMKYHFSNTMPATLSSPPKLTVIYPELKNPVAELLNDEPLEIPSRSVVLAFSLALSVTAHLLLLPVHPWRLF